MLPPFGPDGNLPPGEHVATWHEVVERFGTTLRRRILLTGLYEALVALREAKCPRVWLDGSFVTAKPTPGDFDACWQSNGTDIDRLIDLAPVLLEFENQRAAQKARYGGELFPAEWPADAAGTFFLDFFQVDKLTGDLKGIVVIELEELP